MRTLTTYQTNLFATDLYTSYCRVLVDKDGTLTFQDMTLLQNRNWLESVSWTESIDNPCMTASIKFARAVDYLSLSPFMGLSKLNNGAAMLGIKRRIKVQTATVPIDCVPQSADWQLMFDGYIDELDPASDSVIVSCRDLGGLVQDYWVRTEKTYGSGTTAGTGTAIQTVIQNILDDAINTPNGWVGAAAITLTTVGTPAFLINAYIQRKQSVMEAIRTLALQIAWDVKYVYDSASGTFKLTLFQPNRTAGAALATFSPDDYDAITQAKISVSDIRNYIVVPYSDNATGTRQLSISQDATSIATFGLRYMEISEASNSQINTLTEAAAMGAGALSDLKSPVIDQSVSMPYYFPTQLGDSYTWKANNRHYDADQQLAVVGYTHTFDSSGGKSEMQTRGVAAGGYMRWLAIEGRSGVAPTAALYDPTAPQNVTSAGTPGTIIIVYDSPVSATNFLAWSHTEVWGKPTDGNAIVQTTTSGKFQRPTGTGVVLYASAKKTRFEIAGLTPGAGYDFAIVILDLLGNISGMVTMLNVTAQAVGPYHESQLGQKDQLIRNPDLNIYTLGTSLPPDGWFPVGGTLTWSSSFVDTTNQLSGGTCITIPNGTGSIPSMRTVGIPCAAGDVMTMSAYCAVLTAGKYIHLEVDFYDVGGLLCGGTSSVTVIANTNYRNVYLASYPAPSLARSCGVSVAGQDGFRMDRVYMQRAYSCSNGQFILPATDGNSFGTAVVLNFTTVTLLGIAVYQPGTYVSGWTITVSGLYNISADLNAIAPSTTAISNMKLAIIVSHDGGSTFSNVSIGSDRGVPSGFSGGNGIAFPSVDATNVELSAGDIIRFTATSDQASSVVTSASSANGNRVFISMAARSET